MGFTKVSKSVFSPTSGAKYPSDNPVTRVIERVVEKVKYVVDNSGNPDSSRYRIDTFKKIDKFLIVWIVYPNCTNYEGQKILVYQNIEMRDLLNQKLVDPHFSNNTKYHSPIARFVPTNEGWEMAKRFARAK